VCYSHFYPIRIVTPPLNPGVINGNQAVCIGGTSQFHLPQQLTDLEFKQFSHRYCVPVLGIVMQLPQELPPLATPPSSQWRLSSFCCHSDNYGQHTTCLQDFEWPTQEVCVAGTTTLSSTSLGGIWSSEMHPLATVNSTSGVVTWCSPWYSHPHLYCKLEQEGCLDATATRSVTVTAPPNAGTLSGPTELCVEEDTIYLSTMPRRNLSSSNSTVATIDGATGQVIGLSAGSTTITYMFWFRRLRKCYLRVKSSL